MRALLCLVRRTYLRVFIEVPALSSNYPPLCPPLLLDPLPSVGFHTHTRVALRRERASALARACVHTHMFLHFKSKKGMSVDVEELSLVGCLLCVSRMVDDAKALMLSAVWPKKGVEPSGSTADIGCCAAYSGRDVCPCREPCRFV